MWATNQVEKTHQIEDIGVQTDWPNRSYSIVNWEGYQPWKLIQWISFIWSVWQKLLLLKCGDLLPTYHHLYLLPPTCHILPLPASFTLSTCHYLPVSTCHCTTCHYLAPTSACQYLPLSTVSTCHSLTLPRPATTTCCLPLSVATWLPASTSVCHHLQLPTCLNLSPDPVAEIATTEAIQQTKIPNNPQKFLLEDQAQNIFYLVCFLKPWFLTNITSKKGKTTPGFARFFAEKVQKRVRCKWPTRGRTPLPLHNLQMTL